MHKSVRVVPWVVVLGACAPANRDAGRPQQFIAVRQDKLFARVGCSLWTREAGIPGSRLLLEGREYWVDPNVPGLKDLMLEIGVYVSRTAAEQAARHAVDRRLLVISMPVPWPNRSEDVGDACYIWGASPHGGSIVFLRENILIYLGWTGDKAQALAFARRIDEVIRTDPQVAPRGTFSPTPEIVATGVPESMRRKTRAKFIPEFRGLGERAALQIAVVQAIESRALTETGENGKSRPPIIVRRPLTDGLTDFVRDRTLDEDGCFSLKIPDEVGPLKLTMIVATPDNVIVTKDFTINVTE